MHTRAVRSIRASSPLLDQIMTVDPSGFAPAVALRSAAGVAAALGIGTVAANTTAGIAASAGAFNGGTAELARGAHGPIRTMLGAGIGLSICACLGSLTANDLPERVVLVGIIALIAGLLTESGLVPPPVAAQSLIGFVLLGHLSLSLHDGLILAGEILLGTAGQILLRLLIPLDGTAQQRLPRSRTSWSLPATIAIVRSGFVTLRSSPDRSRWHAVRTSIAIVLAELLAHGFSDTHGYWIPLTVVVVLKSDWDATVRLVLARWSGTLLGVIPASIVLTLVHPHGVLLVLLIGLLTWAALAVFRANYALFCVFLSVYVVLSLDVVFETPSTAAADRLLDTTIGVVLALVVFAVVRPIPWKRP